MSIANCAAWPSQTVNPCQITAEPTIQAASISSPSTCSKNTGTICLSSTLTAFLVVTHDPRLAERCDRNIHLVDGMIAEDKPVKQLDARTTGNLL
jgi:hypothetical protein